MHLRTASFAGVATAGLVITTLATGALTTSGSATSHIALRASAVGSAHGLTTTARSGGSAHAATTTAKPAGVEPAGACQTSFGPKLRTVDGIVSWNDGTGTGFNTAGAADVVCLHSRKIATVKAFGYFGTSPADSFHVTFYANDPADGSNEPDDNTVLCDYTDVTGAAGGQYPHHVKTVLTLHPACKLPAGENWVAIQNMDPSQPWYWEMQNEPAGGAAPDWADRNDTFGSGCTKFDNDRYLVDCLGYTYADWMLVLRGARHP